MTRFSLFKTFMVLIAVLFFTAQSSALAHAASHVTDDHSQDCVACDITLIKAQKAVLSPPPENLSRLTLISAIGHDIGGASLTFRRFNSQAPPPRGPPN